MRAAAFALAVALLGGGPVEAAETHVFRVCHNDENDMGSHRIETRRDGEDLIVETRVDLDVSILFLVAWSFASEQREVWRDGRLVSYASRTLDDGEDHDIRADATPDGLDMQGHQHRTLMPADAAPENFWNPDLIGRTTLFDAKKGRMRTVRWVDEGADAIRVAGRLTPATRWRIEGDVDRTLWYGPDGAFLRVDFVEKDRAFTIRKGGCGGG